uniref:LAGLIDADG homing endonuclease n=1 Tax=Phanerochaete carnosa TaxID=231932 RepID=A0A895KWP4_9APHY|nr:LAGLIDADG homing endonuclease [Phanerochaete carnosa]QRZ60422.1 LAGLIDADG homing endonuclease [Phanerochaete carnosa]
MVCYWVGEAESYIFNNNKEIKLIIKIEGKHISYITDIHRKVSNLGYCEQKLPRINTKLGKKGTLNKLMLLHTHKNNNYLELYNKWYVDKLNKNIPNDIFNYFNEESLAYCLFRLRCYATEGQISKAGFSIAFSLSLLLLLCFTALCSSGSSGC